MSASWNGSRLVFYGARRADEPGFWSDHWKEEAGTGGRLASIKARLGWLGAYRKILPRHIPRTGAILEAGAGSGWLVEALRRRRYVSVGLDFSLSAMSTAQQNYPGSSFCVGDVVRLPIEENALTALISLGVAEHFEDGPESLVRDAHRVIAPGGVLVISVPWLNALRRWKVKRGHYPDPAQATSDRQFYQYAFSTDEWCGLLERAGFRIVAQYPLGAAIGLRKEMPPQLQRLLRVPPVYLASRFLLDTIPGPLGKLTAHMLVTVASK